VLLVRKMNCYNHQQNLDYRDEAKGCPKPKRRLFHPPFLSLSARSSAMCAANLSACVFLQSRMYFAMHGPQ
jgi:hypothetical protein